jgi:hypothetical protein
MFLLRTGVASRVLSVARCATADREAARAGGYLVLSHKNGGRFFSFRLRSNKIARGHVLSEAAGGSRRDHDAAVQVAPRELREKKARHFLGGPRYHGEAWGTRRWVSGCIRTGMEPRGEESRA